VPNRDDLHTACRLCSHRKLAELAQKITPRYRWEDIATLGLRLAARLRGEIDSVQSGTATIFAKRGFGKTLRRAGDLTSMVASRRSPSSLDGNYEIIGICLVCIQVCIYVPGD
jgi:hypothetical protein